MIDGILAHKTKSIEVFGLVYLHAAGKLRKWKLGWVQQLKSKQIADIKIDKITMVGKALHLGSWNVSRPFGVISK